MRYVAVALLSFLSSASNSAKIEVVDMPKWQMGVGIIIFALASSSRAFDFPTFEPGESMAHSKNPKTKSETETSPKPKPQPPNKRGRPKSTATGPVSSLV